MTNPYSPNNFSLDSSPATTAATQWDEAPKKSNTGLYVAAGVVAALAIGGYAAHRNRKAAEAKAAEAAEAADRRAEAAFQEAAKRTEELADMHALAAEMEAGTREMEKTRLEMEKTLADLDHKMKVRARALEMLEAGEVDPAKVK